MTSKTNAPSKSDFASRVAGDVATKQDEQSRFAALVAGEQRDNSSVATHLDPRADYLGVEGCVCQSCRIARERS
jgi:hypothetical protein